jgi:hypothetical protein
MSLPHGAGHANVAVVTDERIISTDSDIRRSLYDGDGDGDGSSRDTAGQPSPGQAATCGSTRSARGAGVALAPMKLLGSDRRITLRQAEATWWGSEPVW